MGKRPLKAGTGAYHGREKPLPPPQEPGPGLGRVSGSLCPCWSLRLVAWATVAPGEGLPQGTPTGPPHTAQRGGQTPHWRRCS